MLDGVLRASGATEADRTAARDLQQRIFDSLAHGAKPEELRPDLERLFRSVYARFPKDHPALSGKNPEDAIKKVAERQLKTLTSPWFRGLLGFDPAAALAKIHCPVLILFAEKDPKIDPRKSREIAKAALEKTGQKGFDVQVVPGADHSFEVQIASATSTDRQARQRFSPEFLKVLSSWVVERSGRAKRDAIDRLADKLRAARGLWTNGLASSVTTSETAEPDEIIAAALKKRYSTNAVTLRRVVTCRTIESLGPPQDKVSAALLETNVGETILLYYRLGAKPNWWTRFYDVEPVPALPAPAAPQGRDSPALRD